MIGPLGLLLMAGCYSVQGADVVYNIRDFTTSTNLRKAQITPLSTPAVIGTNIIQSDRLPFTNITDGSFTVTNMVGPVTYRVELIGPFTTTTFTNLIPDTNITINAKDYISSTITPGATVGYSQTSVDAKFRALTNILYVAKSGNDSTGLRNRLDKPFLNISNANVAAVVGDVVHVYPGTYDEYFPLKANLFFHPGAKLHYTSTPPDIAGLSLLNDGGGAVDITISGSGEFINQSGLTEGNTLEVLDIANAQSKFSMQCKTLMITNSQVGGPDHVVVIANCSRFNLEADRIAQPKGGNANADGVLWSGGDNVYIHVKDISVVGNGVWEESSANTATPINMYVEADLINADESAVYTSGSNTNAITWVRSKLLISTNSSTISAISTGKLYVHAQKIWGRSSLQPVIGINAGKVWIEADKVTSENQSYLQVSGGTVDISVQQYEDTHGTVTNGIYSGGGTTTIHGGRIDATGYAVQHVGGTLKINGAIISSVTNSPILVAGSGLTLKDCTLISTSGKASIIAASAQTVTIDGTLTVSSIPTNITFQGGTLIVISNQTVYGNMVLATVGRGLQIKEGSNAKMGTNALVNGTVTVSTTEVTATSRISLTKQVGAGATRGMIERGTIVPGTSFVIQAADADGNVVTEDESIVFWMILEPSP